jgi:hypothetical protein
MGLSLILTAVCAGFALLTWRHSKTVMTRHSTTSLRVELDAMHDAIGKHSDLLKRINLRSVMAERRANGAGPESGSESSAGTALSHKDQLRRRAGIVAGKPAPHG